MNTVQADGKELRVQNQGDIFFVRDLNVRASQDSPSPAHWAGSGGESPLFRSCLNFIARGLSLRILAWKAKLSLCLI